MTNHKIQEMINQLNELANGDPNPHWKKFYKRVAFKLEELQKDKERIDGLQLLAKHSVIKFTIFENGLFDLAVAKEGGETLAYHGSPDLPSHRCRQATHEQTMNEAFIGIILGFITGVTIVHWFQLDEVMERLDALEAKSKDDKEQPTNKPSV